MAQSKTMTNKGSGFKFKWWMAVLIVGLIVGVGVLIRVLSFAGGSGGPYNKYRAYVYTNNKWGWNQGPYNSVGVVQFKQTDFGNVFAPSSSEFVTSIWGNSGYYPKAAGDMKANTVARWVDMSSLGVNGIKSEPGSLQRCAMIRKLINSNGKKSLTAVTAIPPMVAGDTIEIIPTTDCNSPAQG